MEVNEVIRRWQAKESQRSIARATGLSRNTVEKYVRRAAAEGLSRGGEPPGEGMVARLIRRIEPGRPTLEGAPSQASLIDRVAVSSKTMPLGNATGMTQAERDELGAWIRQGAKIK